MAATLLGSLHQNLFNGSVKTAAVAAGAKPGTVDVMTLMEAYFIAYGEGKFTLGDGTVLGKPSASIVFTNGSLASSIPNDTAQGIVEIFIEAINDSIYQTPLFYSLTQTTTYTNFWVPAQEVYASLPGKYNDSYVELYRESKTSNKDYFLKGAVPTSSKFLPCYQVEVAGANGKKPDTGLTQQEVQFIRAVSSLTSKQSQALGSLIFQTFGGASAGQFVFLHFSVGNSATLSGIVSVLLSSSSYHFSEWELTNVFLEYDGMDPTVNLMLQHYQDLLSIVTKN